MGPRTTKTRHKADNTFRFDTYAEKLAKINASIFSDYRSDYSRGALDTDTSEPYLLKCIQKWSDLDISADFVELMQQIGTQIHTLAQIVHDERKLKKVLYDFIQVEKRNSLSATFELVTALESDLGRNFNTDRYRYIKRIVNVVVLLKDAGTVEQAFKCLARMIKNGHLGTMSSDNFIKYVSLAKPLLDSNNVSLQVLACQCFSHSTGQRMKKNPVGTYNEIRQMIEKYEIPTDGIATLLFCSIRGPQGVYTADGQKVLEEILKLCFQDTEHSSAHLWSEVVLLIVQKLFKRGCTGNDGKKGSDLAIRLTNLHSEIQNHFHAEHYFNFLKLAVSSRLTKEGATFGNTNPVLVARGLLQVFLKADVTTWTDVTMEQVSNILITICTSEKDRLEDEILQAVTTFLTFNSIPDHLKRLVLYHLFAYPTSLESIMVECQSSLPPSMSSLTVYSDFVIHTRKLLHQRFSKTTLMSFPPFHPYASGEICTAVDIIKETRRPRFPMPDLSSFEFESFWAAVAEKSSGSDLIQKCLCLNLNQYSSYIDFFIREEAHEYWDEENFLPVFLVMADGYFESLFQAQTIPSPVSELIGIVNKLIDKLQLSLTIEDGKDLWILKTLDFLLASLAFTSKEMTPELKLSEITNMLEGYLKSGYVVLRLTAVSIYYHIATLLKKEGLKTVCEKCLEIELWNMDAPSQSSINKLMEDLIIISWKGKKRQNRFLVNYSLGLLFSKYEPIRKQCKVLIQSCCEASNFLDIIVFNILKQNEAYNVPKIPKCLIRIVKESDSTFERYELSMFDRKSVGNTEDGSGYTQLNYGEYWSLVWEVVATIKDISTVSSDFKSDTVKVCYNILRQYIQTPPHFGFKETPDGDPPNFLVNVVTWLGRCWRFDSVSGSAEQDEILIHFLMSGNSSFRKAGIGAMYNLDRRLENYRVEIDTFVEGKIVDLTCFAKEAAIPIINDRSHRGPVMNLVLALVAQRLWSSLSSKRKVSSKSLSPILLGLMGFAEAEVERVIDLLIGGYTLCKDSSEFKSLSVGNLFRKIRLIELMITHWKQAFPKLSTHLVSMAIQFIRIVDSLEADLVHEPETNPGQEAEVMEVDADENGGNEDKPTGLLHRRQIVAAGFRIVKFIYETMAEMKTFDEKVFEDVYTYVVVPRLEKLVETSTGGVSTVFNFLKVWSVIPRYRSMLLRILPGSNLTPVDSLVQVLESKTSSGIVKKFILELFFNLLEVLPVQDETQGEISHLDENVFKKLDYPTLNLETNILLHLKPIFLCFESVSSFLKLVMGSRENCGNLLKVMRLVISTSSVEQVKEIGPKAISDRMLESIASKAKVKGDYLALLREIVNKLPDDEEIIIYLARNFRLRINSTGKDSIMGMLDGFSDVTCKEALVELSADDPNDLTSPDYARRAKGWQMLEDMFTGHDATFHLPRFMLIGNYLLGILSYDNQAVQVQNALRIFNHMSKFITQTKPPGDAVKTFLNGVLMSRNLATIVKWKDNPQAFSSILLLLRIFVLECSSYDHILQGLTPLCSTDEEQDILCELTSIQVNNRTKAMNKLLKLLELQITEEESKKPFSCFGVNLLRDYLVPLATFSIQSERVEKSGANKAQSVLDNLVDCSIKVYRTAAQLFTPAQYLQFLNEVLSHPPDDTIYTKRFKRVLLAVIHGFKYTLVPSETAPDGSENKEGLIQIPETQVQSLTNSFRPILERLNERLCNFTGKKGSNSNVIDYSLMAECTLGVAKLLERFPPTLSEPLKDKLVPDICACMKSKEHRTRLLARNTLRTLMSVQTRFISFSRILNYLKANLKVGYQKHVLNHTVYTLLSSCKERFEANPSEVHVKSLLPLCETEFFGIMDEEKGIGKITEKTAEARNPNAKNILEICAQITQTPADITEMISCGLSQLKLKRSEKNVSQVKKWMDAVQTGVSNNKKIDLKQVLTLLEDKMKEYDDAVEMSNGKPTTVTTGVRSKVNVNSMDIDLLPSKVIRDSLTTEKELLLHFQLKLLYNSFRSFNQQLYIAQKYYVSAVENLKHHSHEIMLLSHRLVTMFLSWDQTEVAVPKSLLPGELEFTKFWGILVGNVVKYCETAAAEETVNVIFTTITTFLSVHTEMKLMKKDLTVILSTLKSFLNNGHCVSSAMKFLTSIIEIKPEAVFLEDIMDDVLKVSTRSTTSHVVETYHKVYLKYLMVYGSSRKGALNGFLTSIWTSAKEATFSYQAANLLSLVHKIIGTVPASSIDSFFGRLPILLLELLHSDLLELQSHCLAILDTFLGIPSAIRIVVPIGISLMKKEPQLYDPFVVLYVIKVFNAVTRSDAGQEQFLLRFKQFMKNLVRKSDSFQMGLKVGFQQLQDVVEKHVRDKLWTSDNIRKWKIRKLIQLMVQKGLEEESHVVRSSTLRLVSFILNSTIGIGSVQLIGCLNPTETMSQDELPAPFLKNLTDLKCLMDGHFGVIDHSSNADLEEVEEVITNNLNIFVQLLCHFGSEIVAPSGTEDLAAYFIGKVKRLMNREVTQKAEEITVRRICYTLLKTYVHLADAEIDPYDHIGLPAYEKRKGPFEYEELPLKLLTNVKGILLLAIRDSTDSNVKDDIRRRADRICSLLNGKLGAEFFNPLDSDVRQILHTRRRMNKAKKAETAVTHPGLKRKRPVKAKGKDGKIKKKKVTTNLF